MKKEVKNAIENLKDVIFLEITQDKLEPQDVIDICNSLVTYLEDEKIGMEEILEEKNENI